MNRSELIELLKTKTGKEASMTKRVVRRKAWAVFGPNYERNPIRIHTVNSTSRKAIRAFLFVKNDTFDDWAKMGYTVRPVIVEYEIPQGKLTKSPHTGQEKGEIA